MTSGPAAAGPAPARPRALGAGDRVVLVCPSGPVDAERIARTVASLRSWGLEVTVGPHAAERTGFLAGADRGRAADLVSALTDPAVRGMFCGRGGYGAQRIVDEIPDRLDDPPVVVGFSDITAVHLALWRRGRIASLHGPGSGWWHDRLPAGSSEEVRRLVTDPGAVTVVAADPDEPSAAVRSPGRAEGPLLGGNLSLLETSIGTPDFPDLAGAVLMIEDVGEAPYRIDRMLTHLLRVGALAEVAGIAVGQFTDCDGTPAHPDAVEVVAERLLPLGAPVLGGLRTGHGTGQVAVPLGVGAVLDADAGTLTVDPLVR
ncbi:MAG: S66 peptidase family protein [Mycobacteriales bacterium]